MVDIEEDRRDRAPFEALRKQALVQNELMKSVHAEARKAGRSGHRALARTLNERGRSHKAEKKRLNEEASRGFYQSKF